LSSRLVAGIHDGFPCLEVIRPRTKYLDSETSTFKSRKGYLLVDRVK